MASELGLRRLFGPIAFYAALFLVLILSLAAHAETFRNAYVQFELPSSWKCAAEGTEWVCSSQNKNDAKESIIVLTAKEAGPQDTFEIYEGYLKKPKPVPGAGGKVENSILKNGPLLRKINDQQWVDALHMGSEIPGYYTRYLATVKDKLAILVTLSAHQKAYSKYSNDYFRAVESLRVIASKDILAPPVLTKVVRDGDKVGTAQPVPPPPGDDNGPPAPDEGGGIMSNPAMLGGVFLLLVAGIYLFLKKSKKS